MTTKGKGKTSEKKNRPPPPERNGKKKKSQASTGYRGPKAQHQGKKKKNVAEKKKEKRASRRQETYPVLGKSGCGACLQGTVKIFQRLEKGKGRERGKEKTIAAPGQKINKKGQKKRTCEREGKTKEKQPSSCRREIPNACERKARRSHAQKKGEQPVWLDSLKQNKEGKILKIAKNGGKKKKKKLKGQTEEKMIKRIGGDKSK